METRSNQIIVGSVVIGLVVGLVFFLMWLSQPNRGGTETYDILFNQSVGGLTKGAQVTYSGVPVGQVDSVSLAENPVYIRVRITIDNEVPVLAPTPNSETEQRPTGDGTVASLSQVGFTGPIQIELSTPPSRVPVALREELTCIPPPGEDVCYPNIPVRAGGLAGIIDNAPQVIEQFRQLAERLTDFFSPRNQENIADILENVEALTESLGDRGPEIAATLAEAQTTLRQAGTALERIGRLAESTETLVQREGTATAEEIRLSMAELRTTLQAATQSLETLQGTLEGAQPGIQSFTDQTLPEVGALVRDLQDTSQSLRQVLERVERRGVGGLLGGEDLPDYEPK